jgi:hypothetical protein
MRICKSLNEQAPLRMGGGLIVQIVMALWITVVLTAFYRPHVWARILDLISCIRGRLYG